MGKKFGQLGIQIDNSVHTIFYVDDCGRPIKYGVHDRKTKRKIQSRGVGTE